MVPANNIFKKNTPKREVEDVKIIEWCQRHEILVQIVVSVITSVLTILWLRGR